MGSSRAEFVAGFRNSPPLLLASVPVGFLFGIAAVGVGLPAIQTVVMSVALFTGAARLVMVDLLFRDARAVVVVATPLVINLRYVMYSASIAMYFQDISRRWRWVIAYLLLDVNYAITASEYADDPPDDPRWYFLGVSVPLWLTQQLAVIIGVLVGGTLPESLHIEFAIPLVFVGILVPTVDSRASKVAAVVGAAVAGLPLNLELLVGAIAGLTAGVLVQEMAA